MRALSVRSTPAFKPGSALARITCTAALARERTRVSLRTPAAPPSPPPSPPRPMLPQAQARSILTTSPLLAPSPPGISAVVVALGSTHTCAIVTEGGALCWVDHSGMKLGDCSKDNPYATMILPGATRIALYIIVSHIMNVKNFVTK